MSESVQLIHAAQAIELPPGWSSATIEGLVGKDGVFVDGDWVESKDQDPTGDVRLIQLADIGDGEYRNKSDRFLTHEKALELGCTFLNKGDVLIARMPDPLGRACLFPGDRKKSVTVVDVAIVRSDKGEFNHRWLMYFINAPAFRTSVASLQSGSTRKRISRGNLARISLPVPPREQQDRIVAEIEEQFPRLDEAVANLKRVKANLKRYKASVLKAAVEGKLTEDWRKQHPNVESASQLLNRILAERRAKWSGRGKYIEPSASETTDLPSLPKGWTWATVEQLSLLVQYGSSAKTHEEAIGVPVLRMGNIEDGRLRFDSLKYLPKKHDEFPELFLRDGDILFNRTNSAELVGKTAVYKGKPAPCSFASYLIRIRLTEGYAPDLLAYFINSVFGRAWISQVVSQQVGQANVNGTKLQALTVPLPPLDEQRQIIAEVERRLSVIEELEASVSANLTRAERLRQSILSKAFSGRLVGRERSPAIRPAEFSMAAESQARYAKDDGEGR